MAPSLADGMPPAVMGRVEKAKICEPGGGGLVFPLIEAEQGWNWILRGVLYASALCYLFLGVSIVADTFMNAIETITSKKKRVREKGTGRLVTVAVWNGTVANLTLLALGSSAPEILLSVVETVRNNFHSGQLGPSTIIGSAAFNLFVIIAVCIMAIPSTESRAIKENTVFAITAVFSLFAYFWLVFIVQISSPDIVELWEAILTLAFLPVLIFISYAADVGMWPFKEKVDLKKGKLMMQGSFSDIISEPDHGYGPSRFSGFAGRPAGGGIASLIGGGPEVLTDNTGRPLGGPAGVICFGEDATEIAVGFRGKQFAVPVYRRNGCEGAVTCKFRTEALTAVPGYDFVKLEGELTFRDGERESEALVELLPKRLGEHSDQFQLILEEPEGGAIFNPSSDGGEERCVLTITILNENDRMAAQSAALRAGRALDGCLNLDSLRRGLTDWRDQILDSVFDVSGDDDGAPLSLADYAWHLVSLPWKFLFAVLVPPPAFLGGWLCFGLSLAVIGGLTAIVIDFAELFGCVTGIEDSITAITFVALGTSMPDLFASVSAAKADETADASIVNVTGSNSVNVFVGIGVPWTMAAIYWKVVGPTPEWVSRYSTGKHTGIAQAYPEGGFIVPGGDLAFGVVVFTVGALLALALIRLRRVKFGGELGGPFGPKVLSSFMLTGLWFFYVGLYIWKVVNPAKGAWSQVYAIFIALVVLENVLLVAFSVLYALGFIGGKEKKAAEPAAVDEEKALPPPPLPPPLSGHPSAFFGGTVDYAATEKGRFKAQQQHFDEAMRAVGEAGFMAGVPTMGCTESLVAPSIEISKVISLQCAAMVCLAATRLKRSAKARTSMRSSQRLQLPWPRVVQRFDQLQRPAALPPAYSLTARSLDAVLQAPPPPPAATLQRCDSFCSANSGSAGTSARGRSWSPPPAGPSVMQSVGGRALDWAAQHRGDGLAMAGAGLAAAMFA